CDFYHEVFADSRLNRRGEEYLPVYLGNLSFAPAVPALCVPVKALHDNLKRPAYLLGDELIVNEHLLLHDYVRAAGFFILVELIGKPSRRGALLAGVGEAAEPVKLHFLDKLAKLLKLLL